MTAEELRAFRVSQGLNQTEFGGILGYHQPQIRISEFERGVRVIPKRIREFVAEIQSGRLRLDGFAGQAQEKNVQSL